MRTVRVGTRGSRLALIQTGQVIESLRAIHPGVAFEAVIIRTTGDAQPAVPFAAVGVKGMFTKEIEEALHSAEIDLGVHSMKDMPGELPDGLELAAIPERRDPRDALVSHGPRLAELPAGALIGTSSLRRQAMIRAHRPDLRVEELRGNLDTRLRKLDEGKYEAIVLACAGLERMGWEERITERIPVEVCVPAPGQGALALETRLGNIAIQRLVSPLHHEETSASIRAERAFQAALGAGCTVPVGAHATVTGGELTMLAACATPDGSRSVRVNRSGPVADPTALGIECAEALLARGGREILKTVRLQ